MCTNLILSTGVCNIWPTRRDICGVGASWIVLLSKLLVFQLDWNLRWISTVSIFFVFFGLTEMTISAQRHVHVHSTDHALYIFWCCPKSKTRLLLANLANSRELLNFFTLRYQIENCRECFSHECALKWRHDHNFSKASCRLCKTYLYRVGYVNVEWLNFKLSFLLLYIYFWYGFKYFY